MQCNNAGSCNAKNNSAAKERKERKDRNLWCFALCTAKGQNRSVPRRFLPRMARMARIMAIQKAVCRVFIREIREIRGSIHFGCGFAALGSMWSIWSAGPAARNRRAAPTLQQVSTAKPCPALPTGGQISLFKIHYSQFTAAWRGKSAP